MNSKPIIILCMFFGASMVRADVFNVDASKSQASINKALFKAIAEDRQGRYFKDVLDMDIRSANPDFTFSDNVSAPSLLKKFDFEKNVLDQIRQPMFFNNSLVNSFARQIEHSPLLLLQYSSPAAADLFKFYTTLIFLRSQMMYAHLQDLDNEQSGSMGHFHRQSIYDCLKQQGTNLISAYERCMNQTGNLDGLFDDEKAAGEIDINKEVFNMMNRSLGRSPATNEIIQQFNDIVPRWKLERNGFKVQSPQRIGNVFFNYKDQFINMIKTVFQDYQSQLSVDEQTLEKISLPAFPITEQMIRDLSMIDPGPREIVFYQWASGWAMVRTIQQYELAREWVGRALLNPRIKQAYKIVFSLHEDYLSREMQSLETLKQSQMPYVMFLQNQLKHISEIKDEWIKTKNQVDQSDYNRSLFKERLYGN